MARQPDIQYIQPYNYGSTARKLDLRSGKQREKYQPPEQKHQLQRQKRNVLDPVSICALVVACFMLVTMMIGMLRVGKMVSRQQELESYIDALYEQRANLQKTYESSYDLAQVEERARQMGLVYANEVYHVPMGTVGSEPQQDPSFSERLAALFDELFAKAPK